jgi:hypothetical protein
MILSKQTILKAIICLFAARLIGITNVTAKGVAIQADPFAALRSKGYQQVRVLKSKKGELLGYVFVKEDPKYSNHVLTALLVVKAHGLRIDTLYQINTKGDFINSLGKIELRNPSDNVYYGFKLHEEIRKHMDLFSIGETDRKGQLFSDDNDFLIDWDYKTHKFHYYPAP